MKLAPCPICGCKGEFRELGGGDRFPQMVYAVCQYNCVRLVGEYGTRNAAALVWNRRPLMDALHVALEDVRRTVREMSAPPDRTTP